MTALFLILLDNPFAAKSVSLQLSFGAVVGLLWLSPKLYRGLAGESAMSDLKKYLDKQLADPAFAEEYEKQRPEYEAIRAMIAARLDSNMTQKELAEKTGIRQSNLSRIENGTCSPTVETLSRIAAGLGKQLKIEFY